MGRSRGGLTTKVHAVVDANGLPIGLALSEGQAYDGHSAPALLDSLAPGSILLADRAYDADKLRKAIASKGAFANIPPMPHGRDVGKRAFAGDGLAQLVGIIGSVGEQDRAGGEAVEQRWCAVPVIGLALAQREADRQAVGIDDGMNLGGQAAARATHATGSAVFFFALAACWCTRIEELSIIWMSPT
jgi:transposase